MSSEKYIGMDVHQATISVAVLDSQGKTIMESILETKASTILEFLGGVRGTLFLKDYAQGQEGQEDVPVQEKGQLFKLLDDAIQQGSAFCRELDIDIDSLLEGHDVFKKVDAFGTYADKLLTKDEWRKGFAVYENTISGLYEACKPEILGKPVVRSVAVFQYLRGVVEAIVEQKDLDAVGIRVGELLDESLVVDGGGKLKEGKPEFRITQSGKTWDLSTINFEKLKEDFQESKYKNIEIADLRAFVDHKLERMLHENATRTNFAMRLQGTVSHKNVGTLLAKAMQQAFRSEADFLGFLFGHFVFL